MHGFSRFREQIPNDAVAGKTLMSSRKLFSVAWSTRPQLSAAIKLCDLNWRHGR